MQIIDEANLPPGWKALLHFFYREAKVGIDFL
jgi:hypothetical protein